MPFEDAEKCTQNATVCLRMAEAAPTPNDRHVWLKLAEGWEVLAQKTTGGKLEKTRTIGRNARSNARRARDEI